MPRRTRASLAAETTAKRAPEAPAPKKKPAAPTAAETRTAGVLADLGHRFDGVGVLDAAKSGVRGAGRPLPWLDTIQRSFGRHDLGGVQAHSDLDAQRSVRALGASAFTAGEHVAFAGAPALHTAAHEAAHVIQQRQGVELPGGLGLAGDAFERRADQVAERVVQGRSSEALLGAPLPPPPPREVHAVQRDLKNAIVFAVHAGVNLTMPYSVGGVIQALRALPDRSAFKYTGLLAALKQGLPPSDCAVIDQMLADQVDTKTPSAPPKSGGPAPSETFVKIDHDKEARLAGLVTDLIKRAIVQVQTTLGELQKRKAPGDDKIFHGLQIVFGYLGKEVTRVGDDGLIVWTSEENGPKGTELAETSKTNHGITLRKPFFALSTAEQVDTLIHEVTHAVLGTEDVAYYWERIFQLMSPAAHLKNADSFAVTSRQLGKGENKLPGRRFAIKDGVVGVPPKTEAAIALVEHWCLYGSEAFENCHNALSAAPAASASTVLPTTPEVSAFYARLTEANLVPLGKDREVCKGFAMMFKGACNAGAAALRKTVTVVAVSAGPVEPNWVASAEGVDLTVRVNDDLPAWLCATLFRDLGGLTTAQAKMGRDALRAMFRDSKQPDPFQ